MRWFDETLGAAGAWLGAAAPAAAPAALETPPAPAPASAAPATSADPGAAAAVMGHWAEGGGQAQLDAAMKVVNENLDEGLITTRWEARKAARALNDLPPAVREQAMARMNKAQFDDLMDEVLDDERADTFRPIFEATADPARKLQIWEEMHVSQLDNDVSDGEKAVDASTGAAKDEEERWQERREATAATGKGEVETEVALLRAKGKDLTAADVAALAERKELEHRLESTFNQSFTNDGKTRKDGSRVIWTTGELRDVEMTMAALPQAHVAGNAELREVRRQERGEDPTAAAQYHQGSKSLAAFDRHEGDDDLKGHIAHELGHAAQVAQPDPYGTIKAVAGWQTERVDDLNAKKVDIDVVRRITPQDPSFEKDGRQYRPNRYQCGDPEVNPYWSVKDVATPQMPDPRNAIPGDRYWYERDPWSYARSDPRDYFAELYRMSTQDPDFIYHDMVSQPAADAAAAPAQTRDQAIAARDQRLQIRNTMRNDVLHTDVEVAAAEARLRAQGVPEEQLATFSSRAQRAGAPFQVNALEEELELARRGPDDDEGTR